MVKQVRSATSDILFTASRTVGLDVPITALQGMLSITEKRALTETAWRSYDTAVRLASASIDSLYRSGLLGVLLARVKSGFCWKLRKGISSPPTEH
jgi:hypothetical protein